MTWFILIILALVVFMNRYILLEPNLPLRLPKWFQQSLQYSAPCLLTAIATPIVFMDEHGAFRESLLNPSLLTEQIISREESNILFSLFLEPLLSCSFIFSFVIS